MFDKKRRRASQNEIRADIEAQVNSQVQDLINETVTSRVFRGKALDGGRYEVTIDDVTWSTLDVTFDWDKIEIE